MFSSKLKEARAKTGLSQKGLADALGTSRRNIENWEGGKNEPEQEKQAYLLQRVETLTKPSILVQKRKYKAVDIFAVSDHLKEIEAEFLENGYDNEQISRPLPGFLSLRLNDGNIYYYYEEGWIIEEIRKDAK